MFICRFGHIQTLFCFAALQNCTIKIYNNCMADYLIFLPIDYLLQLKMLSYFWPRKGASDIKLLKKMK